ncbi:MAG: 4Fe-4S binding protein [Salinivirgaceae bacterium]|jgi:polyferredoxin|nr:4Fe-4S binding protein [Salinivirgaceae bacterium]
MTKKPTFIKHLAKKRALIQAIVGISLYLIINYFNISLWWVLGFGSAIGIIWGKVFCRWMCPLGIMMELLMKISPNDALKGMYQYHKIGCPIAWISGLLNKVSFYKIQFNADTCKNCGICDSACYMPTLDKQKFSLYKPNMVNPAENYSCSKCLQCVAECPNGSLTYKLSLPTNSKKHMLTN